MNLDSSSGLYVISFINKQCLGLMYKNASDLKDNATAEATRIKCYVENERDAFQRNTLGQHVENSFLTLIRVSLRACAYFRTKGKRALLRHVLF